MAGRPRLASDEQLLAATARAISRIDPNRLTLADVAREAGVASATLVQRFGSKRALLLAFTANASKGVEEAFAKARARHSSPLRALIACLAGMTAGMREPAALGRHLAFLQLELSDPEFHEHTSSHAKAVREQICLLLDDAVEQGELGPCDTRRLANAVHVAHNGALITWVILRQGRVDDWLRSQLEFLLAPYRKRSQE